MNKGGIAAYETLRSTTANWTAAETIGTSVRWWGLVMHVSVATSLPMCRLETHDA